MLIENARMQIGTLAITLNSTYEFLYESILRLMTDFLLDLFNSELGSVLAADLFDTMNVAL